LLYGSHDLFIYDLADCGPHSFLTGAQILRNVQGRVRQFLASGTSVHLAATPPVQLVSGGKAEQPAERTLLGYDRLPDVARIRWQLRFAAGAVDAQDTLRLVQGKADRRLVRELRLTTIPAGAKVEVRTRIPADWKVTVTASAGELRTSTAAEILTATFTP